MLYMVCVQGCSESSISLTILNKSGCFSDALEYSVVADVDGNNENVCILIREIQHIDSFSWFLFRQANNIINALSYALISKISICVILMCFLIRLGLLLLLRLSFVC